jgi:hypothetical protein
MRLQTLDCPKCGAALEIPRGRAQMHCAYCGSSVVVPQSLRSLPASSAPTSSATAQSTRVATTIATIFVFVIIACVMAARAFSALDRINVSPVGEEAQAGEATPALALTVAPSVTPTYSATYIALHINEYADFTVYWKRELWDAVVGGPVAIEDFEKDESGYEELYFPYLTGNEFYLMGESSAQMLTDETIMATGNSIHFRDWSGGLTFGFPNGVQVSAFSFDFVPSEDWELRINDTTFALPAGRSGFVGVVMHQNYPAAFILSGPDSAQGGISVDNIGYVAATAP